MTKAEASPWVRRFAPRIPTASAVLDVACGGGRHSRILLDLGHRVTAIDRDLGGVADITDEDFESHQADLEIGAPWPLPGRTFAAVVVTNYLHRPLFPDLLGALAPGGLLIYETFARGNERFGQPKNPDFLLKPGELLDIARFGARDGGLRVLAYEDLEVTDPKRACIQHIAANKAET